MLSIEKFCEDGSEEDLFGSFFVCDKRFPIHCTVAGVPVASFRSEAEGVCITILGSTNAIAANEQILDQARNCNR
jgi:hypothetical protein